MLYRRHTQAREVELSERSAEGTAPAEGATYDDTTAELTVQDVTGDGATTGQTTSDENAGEHGGGTSDTPSGAVSEDDYTKDELVELALGYSLSVSGTKAELVERINKHVAEQGD